MTLGSIAKRILRVLDSGPRKANVLRGLAPTQAKFEQAVGQLFLGGYVLWRGKTSGRQLARNGRRQA